MTEIQVDHQQHAGPVDHVLPNGERVLSNREFGRLIHSLLGLHEPTPTRAQLEAMGYEFKEIAFAAKTIALQEAIENLGADLREHEFIPSQGQEWNGQFGLPYRYLNKTDLQREVQEHGMNPLTSYIQQLFIHYADVVVPKFQQKNPELFALMADITFKKPEQLAQDQQLIQGLEGVRVATDVIHALQQKVPKELLGQAVERSMPLMYTLASQNLEGKGSPHVVENITKNEIRHGEKITRMRTQIYDYLVTLPEAAQKELVDYLLELMIYTGMNDEAKDSPEIMGALLELEQRMHADTTMALKYAAGLAVPYDTALPTKFQQSINDRCTYYFGRLSAGIDEDVHPIPDDIKRAANSLGELYFVPEFDESTITIETKDGIPRAVLKRETFPDGTSEPSVFGVEGINYRSTSNERIPVRDIVPDDRTVGCVGMHTRIKPEQLQALMDRTNFHPKEINALSLSALIALDVMTGIDVGPNPH